RNYNKKAKMKSFYIGLRTVVRPVRFARKDLSLYLHSSTGRKPEKIKNSERNGQHENKKMGSVVASNQSTGMRGFCRRDRRNIRWYGYAGYRHAETQTGHGGCSRYREKGH